MATTSSGFQDCFPGLVWMHMFTNSPGDQPKDDDYEVMQILQGTKERKACIERRSGKKADEC